MAYSLGAVKPHVASAANLLGPKYGITTVHGWGLRAGKSDHPLGLALDFMTSNVTIGTALAREAQANAAALGITYIIWNRQIWSVARASEGWRHYSSSSDPNTAHTNHVHISFSATPGTGATNLALGTPTALPGADQIMALVDLFRNINESVEWITNKDNWIRIGLFAGGFLLVLFAVFKWSQIADTVKKVIPSGK